MAKPLKIVLWIVGILLLVVMAIAIALPLMFDPNDYRTQIQDAVKDATGRAFTFGTIELKMFPRLGVEIADAELGNAPGFGTQPFARIGDAGVGVRVMPLLLDQKIIASKLTLHGLALNLARNAEGVDNWSDIGKGKPDETKHNVEVKGEFDLKALDVAGIDIKDSSLDFVDAQAHKEYHVKDLDLETGAIRSGEPLRVSLKGKVASTAPKADVDIELKGRAEPDFEHKKIAIDELKLQVKGKALDYDTDVTLAAKIAADLGAQLYKVDGIDLSATLAGGTLPGGKQDFGVTGNVAFDQGKGTLELTNAKLKAAGLAIDATIRGENMNGDAPRLSGPISVAPFNPREWLAHIGQKIEASDAEALKQASLTAQYSGSLKSASFDQLVLKLDQTTAQGSFAVRDFDRMAMEFALKIDQIDADRYLPPKAKTGNAGGEGKGDINDIKLPTETLEKLNANGTIDIGNLKYNNIKMNDVRLKLSGAGGGDKQQEASARLYGGTFSTSNRISPGKTPAFALKTQLTALNAAPFLVDLLGKDYLTGLGNLTLDLTGRGDTVGEVRRALNGSVALKLDKGAVKGFNLEQIVSTARATLNGGVASGLASGTNAPRQTDFSVATVSAIIVNGILKSDSLDATSAAFRLAGSGVVDLINETIDYVARPTFVDSSRAQGGKALTIPIHLTGNLFAPKYQIDVEDALKEKAKDRINDYIEKQGGKEKLQEKLGDLLFGKKKQQPQQPAQPAPAPQK
jgi:AsmA protein